MIWLVTIDVWPKQIGEGCAVDQAAMIRRF